MLAVSSLGICLVRGGAIDRYSELVVVSGAESSRFDLNYWEIMDVCADGQYPPMGVLATNARVAVSHGPVARSTIRARCYASLFFLSRYWLNSPLTSKIKSWSSNFPMLLAILLSAASPGYTCPQSRVHLHFCRNFHPCLRPSIVTPFHFFAAAYSAQALSLAPTHGVY